MSIRMIVLDIYEADDFGAADKNLKSQEQYIQL